MMMFGKDVIEEGGSSISDVKKTGGGRGKTDTHIGDHWGPNLRPASRGNKQKISLQNDQLTMVN
jgi:hypothetical protein